MTESLALAAVLLGSAWLALVGALCFGRPYRARSGLAAMGSSWPIHLGEHALRALFGLALIKRADLSKAPQLFEFGGWFIVATSLLIVVLPRNWHMAYARWWACRLPIAAYPSVGLVAFAIAGLLAYAAL